MIGLMWFGMMCVVMERGVTHSDIMYMDVLTLAETKDSKKYGELQDGP